MARTTLDLDEELLAEAQRLSGAKSKKATIEEAMREFIALRNRQALIGMLGTIDLDLTPEQLKEMRRRSTPHVLDEAD